MKINIRKILEILVDETMDIEKSWKPARIKECNKTDIDAAEKEVLKVIDKTQEGDRKRFAKVLDIFARELAEIDKSPYNKATLRKKLSEIQEEIMQI